MPFEPNDELTFKLTAAEAQHLVNVVQQTYQASFQVVMKLTAQAQAQMQQSNAQPNITPMRGDGVDVSDTLPAA